MRYIADENGYLKEISFGAVIVCGDASCVEYAGSVPAGYDSLEDWFVAVGETLYQWKIVDGELTLDPDAPVPDNSSRLFAGAGIEIGKDMTNNTGGYIDFHYNGSASDYTSRIIEKANGKLTVDASLQIADYLFLTQKAKSVQFSQTDNNGELTVATIASYPTLAGIYRVGSAEVAGLPTSASGFGVLVIFNGGSYAFHLYRDSGGALYTAKNNTTSGNLIQKPSSWSKHSYTSDTVRS